MLENKIMELKASSNVEESIRGHELERMQSNHQLSPIDSGYVTSDGEYVAIEIITSNYKDIHIEQKLNFVKALDIQNYNQIRA